MAKVQYLEIEGKSTGYFGLLGILGALVLAGLGAAYYVEHKGHWVTGMDNQIVWGTPHVFAVFLIVAASGALNVASMASVFGKTAYKPLAPLSGLLAIALLAGGLAVLVLDLGRPDRLIVAMTYYNFRSIFAWNIFLYTGFIAIVAVYLWMMMDRRMNQYSKPVGYFAFFWRLALTTGTGSIFGFLVARHTYDAAILAPMFIVLSFAYGLAIYLLVMMAAYSWTGRPLGEAIIGRLRNLLGIFIVGALYFVIVFHLTNIYGAQNYDVQRFFLLEGGSYTRMFWWGQIVVGSLIPLALIFHPALARMRSALVAACVLVVLGGLAQMYVTIIGGQAYPLEMFPGKEIVSSTFFDGVVAQYTPSFPEVVLGVGGFAIALVLVALAVKVLRFLPVSLADSVVDPHHGAGKA
jgi:Ni/Fe-hydrogenase subunit HybB-like protein